MKKTIERITKQHDALVDVIQWLDEKCQSKKVPALAWGQGHKLQAPSPKRHEKDTIE